ncbi:unnamed protein product [Peronospora destructor]|uniref:Uncharacterized protein n=1 Tax=Peronospora destructor TaxID=86335 RepID=A0AAV0U8Y8_9STRA|nr:unnamed protein product [Peronospora destructor]
MQPLNSEESNRKVFNATGTPTIGKRRTYVKKEKGKNKRHLKGDLVTLSEMRVTIKSEPGTKSLNIIPATTRSPGPYRGKCLYQSRKCENERAVKRNGQPHNLCEGHRSKQNQHQRKFDAKKFLWKRHRENESSDDLNSNGDNFQLHQHDEPIVKRHRVMANEEEETVVSSAMIDSQHTTPMVGLIKGNNPSTYAAGFTPMSSLMMTKLPLLQSSRRPILPTSPEILYGSVRPSTIPEMYFRGHVELSGYRCKSDGLQSSRVSHHLNVPAQQVTGYTHSELLAASILVQPYTLRTALSTPTSHKSGFYTAGPDLGAMITTPRMLLPSLLDPPSSALSASPYHRVSRMLTSTAQRFASDAVNPAASISFCSAQSEGKALPPLMSFGRRQSPASPLLISKQSN